MGKPRLYLDSGLFIVLVKSYGQHQLNEKEEKDAWFTDKLLQAARHQKLELVTSWITRSECRHAGKALTKVKAREFYNNLFYSKNSGILMTSVTVQTAKIVECLYYDCKIDLTPMDLLHLASAIELGCEEFLTTDEAIINRLQNVNLEIRACHAYETQFLPPEYQTDELNFGGE